MSDYKPSALEIEAALASWFSDARLGWKGNPNFANRAFWRRAMHDALVAANAARFICVDTARRVGPAPMVRASDSERELTMMLRHAATAGQQDADHEHPQHELALATTS
jgi:hypothetical protein